MRTKFKMSKTLNYRHLYEAAGEAEGIGEYFWLKTVWFWLFFQTNTYQS